MKDLFEQIGYEARLDVAPLAVRMRPESLDELVGQSEVIGEGTWLRNAIETDSLFSIILYGPAGTGKTTLARIIAEVTKAHFTEVSAISGGVSDLRRVIDEATKRLTLQNMRTILFIDEIHRFSRSQQDALLHAVEDRVVILIGATTENPYFEVNSALNSRSRIIEFKALTEKDIQTVLRRALFHERGLAGAYQLSLAALNAITVMAAGDARMALTTLELAAQIARGVDELTDSDRTELESPVRGDQPFVSGASGGSDPLNATLPTTPMEYSAQQASLRSVQIAQCMSSASFDSQSVGESSRSQARCSFDSPLDCRMHPNIPAGLSAPRNRGSLPPEAPETKEQPDMVIEQRYITSAVVADASPNTVLPYDKKGDTHYDVISAFIKSMRGSDPDAAVYWLARMIEGGEDPKFIARRIYIFASEDIGNADPQALLIAQAAFKATEVIGYPECQLNLSQAAIYMALAPKSNSATTAIYSARSEIKNGPLRAVPNHLRDRHRPGAEDYGKYHYPHSEMSGWVDQQYLPEGLSHGAFYTPGERGWEAYRSEAPQRDRLASDEP